ncbi:DUF4892 domain-containing protein [Amphritea sp. HPY]|uniref:DUF4892 domain-containing protein n=1 Tax=Amphritea sp. HPY TaxID=3421652 RepID=UPI003D7C5AC0
MLKRLLVIGVLLSFCVQPVLAARDKTGAIDHPLLQRYGLSWIVHYQTDSVPDHAMALGPMKKVEGVIAPELSIRLQGRLTSITYRIPDGHGAADVFDHFLAQLEQQNSEMLFKCSSRQCGSSNQWANNMFNVAELYGIDRSQSYLAARVGDAHVALYIVKRGNRRVYAHIDIVQPEQQSADSIANDLHQQGFSWLAVDLSSPAKLAEGVKPLIEYLLQNNKDRIVLAGYMAAVQGQSLMDMILASQANADRVAQLLLEAGVEQDRIETAGVGPLIPSMEQRSSPGVWVQQY